MILRFFDLLAFLSSFQYILKNFVHVKSVWILLGTCCVREITRWGDLTSHDLNLTVNIFLKLSVLNGSVKYVRFFTAQPEYNSPRKTNITASPQVSTTF